jgi:hypothetical protein
LRDDKPSPACQASGRGRRQQQPAAAAAPAVPPLKPYRPFRQNYTIPAADAKRDYLPRLVTFVGAFEHFMSITRSADRRLGGTKKHRAAVVKQAMAYESDDSDDEERALRTFDVPSEWSGRRNR